MSQRVIDVYCKWGHPLFLRYRKDKRGFLMKCYIDRIGEDLVGVSGLENSTDVFCPRCKEESKDTRVGRISLVHGRPAVVVNHGGVKETKT